MKISISHEEKKLFVFGKTAALDEFVGNLHLLAFTNEHLSVVRGGPADRRAFLDRAMVSLYQGHISHLTNYVRSLKQRNKILSYLREGKKSWDEALLDSWDEALAKPGARILSNRMRYVDQMKNELPPGLFGNEILKIHYLSSIGSDGSDEFQFEEQFRKRLFQSRAYDQRTGFTSVGPHRDELKLYVNGKSLGDFGSAGQQRSSLLALYFAQMEIHKEMNGDYPLFLVDDAEAELDEQRLKTFLSYLSQKTQLFLTSAKDFLLPIMPENTRCFEVVRGNVATQQQ